MGSIP